MNDTSLSLVTNGLVRTQPPPVDAKVDEKEVAKLDEIAVTESSPLLVVKTMFPFDLFPTTITVDRSKVTVVYRSFLASQAQSILIPDIMTAIVENSLLHSRLDIVSRLLPEAHIIVENLSHVDANKVRQTIEGLMVAEKRGVNVNKVPQQELQPKLEKMGHVPNP